MQINKKLAKSARLAKEQVDVLTIKAREIATECKVGRARLHALAKLAVVVARSSKRVTSAKVAECDHGGRRQPVSECFICCSRDTTELKAGNTAAGKGEIILPWDGRKVPREYKSVQVGEAKQFKRPIYRSRGEKYKILIVSDGGAQVF